MHTGRNSIKKRARNLPKRYLPDLKHNITRHQVPSVLFFRDRSYNFYKFIQIKALNITIQLRPQFRSNRPDEQKLESYPPRFQLTQGEQTLFRSLLEMDLTKRNYARNLRIDSRTVFCAQPLIG